MKYYKSLGFAGSIRKHEIPANLTIPEVFPSLVYISFRIYYSCDVASRIEWDENKNRRNRAKHGVSFETASLIFEDPNLITRQDRCIEGEQRWHTIGYAERVLTVAHTAEESEGGEVIRIISARRATAPERKLYEKEDIE